MCALIRITLLGLLLAATPVMAANPRVVIVTDMGEIRLELYADKAPQTVDNFLRYVNRYFYDGLLFHRVVKGFVIQSGGHTFDLSAKEADEPVVNESHNGLKNLRGTIAMARLADPDSARSQFYINLSDNANLDPTDDKPGYTVFGAVIEGMDVVDAIGEVPVHHLPRFQHLPVEPVQILKVRVLEEEEVAEP
ncbi:MAG TPA: peptidylprolyl isomerase [Porticoccaceae bacterium]